MDDKMMDIDELVGTSKPMPTLQHLCKDWAAQAKSASQALSSAAPASKNDFLQVCADALIADSASILTANARDLEAAPQFGLNSAQVDRLRLTDAGIRAMAVAVRQIADLPEPIGRVIDSTIR